MKYYVYVLFDWQGIPRYIGKGKDKRINQHESTSSTNWLKNEFIERTFIMLGEIPKIKIAEGLSDESARAIEQTLISIIGRMDQHKGPLTNMTDGGDGTMGFDRSAIERRDGMREKRRHAALVLWSKPNAKQEASERMRGKKRPPRTEEQQKRVTEALRRPDVRQKISLGVRASWEKGRQGKPHDWFWRAAISDGKRRFHNNRKNIYQ